MKLWVAPMSTIILVAIFLAFYPFKYISPQLRFFFPFSTCFFKAPRNHKAPILSGSSSSLSSFSPSLSSWLLVICMTLRAAFWGQYATLCGPLHRKQVKRLLPLVLTTFQYEVELELLDPSFLWPTPPPLPLPNLFDYPLLPLEEDPMFSWDFLLRFLAW